MIEQQIISFVRSEGASAFEHLASELQKQQHETGVGDSPHTSEAATASPQLRTACLEAFWSRLAHPAAHPILLLTPADTSDGGENLSRTIRRAGADSNLTCPVDDKGVDTMAVRSWLAARQRAGVAASLIATRDLAERLYSFLTRRRLIFRLPIGSRLITIEHGDRISESPEALVNLAEQLALVPGSIRRLVVVPTLTTPFEVGVRPDGDQNLEPPPHWVRYLPIADGITVTDLGTTRRSATQEVKLEGMTPGD